jgi:hypothetical protein
MTLVPGFNLEEAEALVAMLAQLEGSTPPPLTAPPFPASWQIVFDSPVIGIFDNKWQLAQNRDVPGQYAVLIRGTVDEAGSIIDDLLSVMIPASGSVFGVPYQLAADPQAAVHLGFTLATFILLFDPENGILIKLIEKGEPITDVFVAGHSQGAAIATICRSFFRYANIPLFPKFNYKTYLFAQPKPGNDHYGDDFESAVSNDGLAFSVLNNQDWVPQVPLTIELLTDINDPNPLSVLLAEHLILAPVSGAVKATKSGISVAQLAKHKPQIELLSEVMRTQSVQPPILTDAKLDIPPILLTFNFIGCGSPIALRGLPGSNPCDPKDFFWQHHAAMYYDLLAGIPIPTDCPS